MPGLFRRAEDRQWVTGLSVSLVAVFLAPLVPWPGGHPNLLDARNTLDWFLRVAVTAALAVGLPFVISFSVLFAGFSGPATEYWDRFAAAAVAAAERRKS
jgi:hypothetical protein